MPTCITAPTCIRNSLHKVSSNSSAMADAVEAVTPACANRKCSSVIKYGDKYWRLNYYLIPKDVML